MNSKRDNNQSSPDNKIVRFISDSNSLPPSYDEIQPNDLTRNEIARQETQTNQLPILSSINQINSESNRPKPVIKTTRFLNLNRTKPENVQTNSLQTSTKKNIFCKIFLIFLLIVLVVITILLIIVFNLKQSTTPADNPEVFISNCSNYSSNNVLSNSPCKYGYSGAYCDECGIQFYKPNAKIVGGVQAIPNSWPSMALIVFRYKFYYQNWNNGPIYIATKTAYCGGTLIDRNTVLTASHCYITTVNVDGFEFQVKPNNFHSTIESMYTVYLGLQNDASALEDGKVTPPGVAMSLRKFTRHPSYSDSSKLNDIAVIKLKKSVTLNCYIQPACLPDPSISNYPTSTNINVWAAGWGTQSYEGPSPNNLNNVKMTLYDSSYCRLVSPNTVKNWNTQICAGEINGGKDTCQGDSGGPLFVVDTVNNKNKFILVGITSYGVGCGQAGYPGIYTKVSPYLSWINQIS